MHKVNAGFTVLLPVREEQVQRLSTLLSRLHAEPARLPFAASSTTHFATITVIPAQQYNDELLPATLLFATSFCGPARAHVDELVRVMGDGLRAIFGHIEGFDRECSDDDLEWFLLKNRTGDTFYSGMQDLSPEDVRQNRALREAIHAFVEEQQRQRTLGDTAEEVRTQIQEHVRSRPDLAWAQEPATPGLWSWIIFHRRSLFIEALALGIVGCTLGWMVTGSAIVGWLAAIGWLAVLAFLVLVVVMFVSIREAEDQQTYISQRPSDERASQIAATQTRPVINEFTLAGPIKTEGTLRPLFLRISLWVVARVAEGVPFMPVVGEGINIPTVATARWIVADGGKRLMFISNYTNEGKAYVRDFIETPGGAKRINLSFGFGTGYPKTRWVAWGGALDDPNAYLYSLAENQLPTLFWYGPYRDTSIDNIKRDRKIREGLFDEKQDPQTWLHLL